VPKQQSLTAIFWKNLDALMSVHGELTNKHRVAVKAKVGDASLDRLKNLPDKAFLSSVLEKVAGALGVPAWQLLYPDLDPAQPPRVLPLSDMAVAAAQALDSVQDPSDKGRIYAVIQALTEFGSRQVLDAMPVRDGAGAPAPSRPPAAAAKAKHPRPR
jgi:hypothetical protein